MCKRSITACHLKTSLKLTPFATLQGSTQFPITLAPVKMHQVYVPTVTFKWDHSCLAHKAVGEEQRMWWGELVDTPVCALCSPWVPWPYLLTTTYVGPWRITLPLHQAFIGVSKDVPEQPEF